MLSCDQQAELAAAVCATAEAIGQTMTASAAELIAQDLAEYEQADIVAALRACRRELTTKLTLGAIMQRIQAGDGRPDPNEAWSIALASADEAESVMMTEEIRQAMSAAAPSLAARDKVGARMSFLSAYQRLVDAARRTATPVSWSLSLGHDPQRRIAAVEEAGRLGRLPAPEVRKHIARLKNEPVTQDGQAIAGLLTGRASMPSPGVREKLLALKADVQAHQKVAEEQRSQEARDSRARFELVRQQQLAALEQRMEVSNG